PFPPLGDAPLWEAVPAMLGHRRAGPPRLCPFNPAVSPAVEAIVRRCLEPDPARRYAGAREVQEDLDRQRESRPLRHTRGPSLRERAGKWARRHPRLTSTTAVALFAALLLSGLLGAWMARGDALAGVHAARAREQFQGELRQARFLLNTRTDDPAM